MQSAQKPAALFYAHHTMLILSLCNIHSFTDSCLWHIAIDALNASKYHALRALCKMHKKVMFHGELFVQMSQSPQSMIFTDIERVNSKCQQKYCVKHYKLHNDILRFVWYAQKIALPVCALCTNSNWAQSRVIYWIAIFDVLRGLFSILGS